MYANLLFLCNVSHLCFGFLYQFIDGIVKDRDTTTQSLVQSCMITRGVLLGLGDAHLAQLVEGRTLLSPLAGYGRCVQTAAWYVYCVTIEGLLGYMAHLACTSMLMPRFGWSNTFFMNVTAAYGPPPYDDNPDFDPDEALAYTTGQNCLNSVSRSAACVGASYNASNALGYF